MQRMAISIGSLAVLALTALAFTGCHCNCGSPVSDPTGTIVDEQGGKTALPSQATFGNGVHRNMVNLVDKNVPTVWNVEEKKFMNVKWVAALGKETHTNPVVYDGRVFIGTSIAKSEGEKKAYKAQMMCFSEKDGKLLWQNAHNMPEEKVIRGFDATGMCSTPTIEGEFIYYCTPPGEVICAKASDGKIVWSYDMMKELKIFPCYVCACSPLIVDDMVFIVTGNGTDEEDKIVAPKAPSFIAMDKKSGKLLWQSNLPGDNIIQGQWGNPAYAVVNGKPQVIFPGGDGYLYGLEPKTGSLIWKFNCSPKQIEGVDSGIQQYLVATPVVHDNRVYIAVGDYPGRGSPPKVGHFFCVDITKSGDVSCKNENFDPKDPANKDSALVWHFGGVVKPPPEKLGARKVYFSYSCSTAAVHEGLVFIAECRGYLHCLDAKTGQHYWEYDLKGEVLASPYLVDGKIFLCTQDSECLIFEASKTLKPLRMDEEKRAVGIDMQESLEATPVVANGVLYIATPSKLYAIEAKK